MLRTVWRGVLVTKSGAVEAKVQVDGKALLERNKCNIAIALEKGQKRLTSSDGAIVITLDPGEVPD